MDIPSFQMDFSRGVENGQWSDDLMDIPSFQLGISIRVLSGLCSFSIFFLLFYSTSSAYPLRKIISDWNFGLRN